MEEKTTNHCIANLQQILLAELSQYQQLRDLLHQEVESLGNISGAALLHIHRQKTQITHKVKELEKQRIEVVTALSVEWDKPYSELSLRAIIAQVSSDEGTQLQFSYDELKAGIGEIQPLGEQIHRLSATRLKPVEASLKFLKDLQKKQQTYSMEGTLRGSAYTMSRGAI